MKTLLIFFTISLVVVTGVSAQEQTIADIEKQYDKDLLVRVGKSEAAERRKRLIFSLLNDLNGTKSGIIDTMELVEDQKKELDAIRKRYLDEFTLLAPLSSRPSVEEIADRRKRENMLKETFVREVEDCLVSSQIDSLTESRLVDKGLPRLLTDSSLVEVLRIRPDQKTRISESADRIAKKIAQFSSEIREESCQTILAELTDEQRKNLYKLYEKDILNQYFRTRQLELLFRDY